jgi:hypothetical protein
MDDTGLVEVTQEQFFAALYADPRDIMPRIVGSWSDETGYTQEWRRNQYYDSALFGRSSGARAMRYWLAKKNGAQS